MYRKYKGQFTRNGLRPYSAAPYLADVSDVESLPSRPHSTMSLSNVELALDTVRDDDENLSVIWDIIQSQCSQDDSDVRSSRRRNEHRLNSRTEWKTVRIFVSSTFTDFHNEREILVKQVFPALREWCEDRRLSLVECDLRWGVPKDSPSSLTVSTCMEELDRCHDETGGQPFFINMLSERYGWVPDTRDLPVELLKQYNWVPGISITHMEILHGAYRSRNPNAVFFVRNPSYLQGMPFDKMKAFIDENTTSKSHLKTLKRKLAEDLSANQVVEYSCRFKGLDKSSGRDKVVLDGLEEFAERVLNFFKEAIDRKFPNRQQSDQSYSQHDQENDIHLSFMELKSSFVRGREKELRALMQFATGSTGVKGLEVMKNKEGNVSPLDSHALDVIERQGGRPDDSAPLCVIGEPGIGKSALAAHFAKHAIKSGLSVLYHCVGCTSDSLRDMKILARIIRTLREPDPQDKAQLPESTSDLYEKLKEQFDAWRKADRQLLIIVDGINEVDDVSMTHCLSWLPYRLPPNIRCVVTVTDRDVRCLSRLTDRQCPCLRLSPLDVSASKEIVEHFFSSYNKRLDSQQMESLLSKKSASVPLWLSMSCEELRVFGDFRMLTRKIQLLPEGLDGLLQVVLSRLVKEDGTGCMIKALSLIYCSQDGLPESEMRRLLGDVELGEEVPMLTWAVVRRSLKPFIHTVVYWYNGVLKIQFFHSSVYQAVQQLLIESEDEERRWHTVLADYYQYHCPDQTYTLEDLPYHLHRAGLYKRIADFYHHDRRSIGGSPHFRQKYLNMIRCDRHTPDIKNLSRPAKICQFCANKTGLVSPLAHPTKTVCVICGSWIVSHPSMQTVARLCIKHFGKFGPTADQCYFCSRVIHGTGGTTTHGLICQMCNSGRRHQTCAKLLY